MDDVTNWLLQGPPWARYRARLDLLGQREDAPEALADRKAMLEHPLVRGLVEDLADWPGKVLSSHKSAGQAYHRLAFAADLGLRADDPGMAPVLERVLANQSPEGPFRLPMNVAPAYGGDGQEHGAWALCDAPVTVYALLRMGLGADPRVARAVDYLAGLARSNGWPCAVSPELGKWRGPGRKDDPCPYATLVMLKALALAPEWRQSPAARDGAACLLDLWEQSRDRHPYMFFMGTDFRKLKAPFVWYDLLHVLEVLTQCPVPPGDRRLAEMLDLLEAKAGADGRYTAESVWKAWEGWDFGQKTAPSEWVTFLARRILVRAGRLVDRIDRIAKD